MSNIKTMQMITDERERALLAPYAMHSANTRGRRHAEAAHPYRGPFQRDRDRILHSAAFRRLSDKTQVFTDWNDYHRTRLTHTMEVASIARTIGRALRLNEDLIEALALLHDIGHPPLGHAGEDALAEVLRGHGGFSHNQFALTLVEELEQRYPSFPGLNLSLEVLESQAARADKSNPNAAPLLEAQVVDLADSITYDAHDTDDAVKLELVSLEELHRVPLLAELTEELIRRHGPLEPKPLRKALVHQLIDYQVSDVLAGAGAELIAGNFPSFDAVRAARFRLAPSAVVLARKRELEIFLYNAVYRHEQVMAVRDEGQGRLKELFSVYVKNPDYLPEEFRHRAEGVGLERAAGEYIAGMTDGFCGRQYESYVRGKPRSPAN